MNTPFDDAALRLMQALGVSINKAAAELLGMTNVAFSERKRRGSFPEDKLRALAQRRPDLRIDVEYVLHGAPPAPAGAPEPQLTLTLPRPLAEALLQALVQALMQSYGYSAKPRRNKKQEAA